MKKVLLVGDIVGYEKIAISAMIPILSNMDCNVNTLLTCVVSNNFSMGISELADLTEYMRRTLEVWKKLEVKFDIIFTGYLTSDEQVEIIKDLIDYNGNPLVVTDPIMGDDGELYSGVGQEVTSYTRQMIEYADIIIPNITEAAILLEEDMPEIMDEATVESWLRALSETGRSVIITSVAIGDKSYVYGIDKHDKDGQIFRQEYDLIPYRFTGTGDIFSSLVLGKLANDKSLQDAVAYACEKISEILKEEAKDQDREHRSVSIERYIKEL